MLNALVSVGIPNFLYPSKLTVLHSESSMGGGAEGGISLLRMFRNDPCARTFQHDPNLDNKQRQSKTQPIQFNYADDTKPSPEAWRPKSA
jgi:hypothetical protein